MTSVVIYLIFILSNKHKMKKINTYKVTITDRETYVMEEIMGTVNNRMWVQFCEMNGVEAKGTRVVRATITKEERVFFNVK